VSEIIVSDETMRVVNRLAGMMGAEFVPHAEQISGNPEQFEKAPHTMAEWQPIESAPRDGTRIRLGHEQEPGSMKAVSIFKTFGHWDGRRWVLSAFFVIPVGKHGMMTEHPTHWLPEPPTTKGDLT